MRIFIRLAELALCPLIMMGPTQSVVAQEPTILQKDPSRVSDFTSWHDGSIGGAYGIGAGWSLEILPPTYEKFEEKLVFQEGHELITIPPTFEWVKEDSETFKTHQRTVTEIITFPATYESITAPEEVKPARTEYSLGAPVYDSTGTLETSGAIKAHNVPAVMKNISRRVIKVPARSEERVIPNVPLVRRDGYVRIVKTPAITKPRDVPVVVKTVTRKRVKHPQSFAVKSPNGEVAHIFRKFEDLTAFVDSLN